MMAAGATSSCPNLVRAEIPQVDFPLPRAGFRERDRDGVPAGSHRWDSIKSRDGAVGVDNSNLAGANIDRGLTMLEDRVIQVIGGSRLDVAGDLVEGCDGPSSRQRRIGIAMTASMATSAIRYRAMSYSLVGSVGINTPAGIQAVPWNLVGAAVYLR